jgi:hypothetical protein
MRKPDRRNAILDIIERILETGFRESYPHPTHSGRESGYRRGKTGPSHRSSGTQRFRPPVVKPEPTEAPPVGSSSTSREVNKTEFDPKNEPDELRRFRPPIRERRNGQELDGKYCFSNSDRFAGTPNTSLFSRSEAERSRTSRTSHVVSTTGTLSRPLQNTPAEAAPNLRESFSPVGVSELALDAWGSCVSVRTTRFTRGGSLPVVHVLKAPLSASCR